MLAPSRTRLTIVIAVIGVVLLAVGGFKFLQGRQAAASASATLTIFIGTVNVQSNGGTASLGHTGQTLTSGDHLVAGPNSKASIDFPDGSVTRIDSNTDLTISSISVKASGAYETTLSQSAGRSWNQVAQLVGGSFKVSAPNNTTAEVRGTTFKVVVDSGGTTLDTYAGAVAFKNDKGSQVVTGGQESTATPNQAPAPPAPISPTDKADAWTIFNNTADVAPKGSKPATASGGTLNQGASTPPAAVARADGRHDLTVTVGWPGSTFAIKVTDASGATIASGSSSIPPLSVSVPKAPAGSTYTVTDVQSSPNEAYWVIVSFSRPATAASPTPAATQPPATTVAPTPVATPSPIETPSAAPSPEGTAPQLPTPLPSRSPLPLNPPGTVPTPSPIAPPPPSSLPTPPTLPLVSPSPSPRPTYVPTPTPTPIYVRPPTPTPVYLPPPPITYVT